MKHAIPLLIVFFFFASCDEESVNPEPQFHLFDSQTLNYEYYYNYEGWEQFPLNKLQLKLTEDVKINDVTYFGFSNFDDTKTYFDYSNNDNILDFNFLPIRYENGKYFEMRGIGELVILKDNMKFGDVWEHTFKIEEETLTYTFEVVKEYDIYEVNSYQYQNVFQIKETARTTNLGSNGDLVSMHFYNKELGIVRREIPMYVSGTYGPIVFNRIN